MTAHAATLLGLFVGGLFVAGALLLWLLGRRRGAAEGAELWRLYREELLIVGAVVLPAVAGAPWLQAALLALLLRGVLERIELDARGDGAPLLAVCMLAGAVLLALGIMDRMPEWAVVSVAAAAAMLLLSRESCWQRFAACLLFPGAAVAGMALLAAAPDGIVLLLLTYLVVETHDAAALVGGRLFGRQRPLPRLSPGKTTAGLVAGPLVALPVGWAFGRVATGLDDAALLLLVLVAILAGVAGDLGTSALKRRRQRKDFRAVLARHGGVLDIYDALLVAAPAVAVAQRFIR